MQAKTSVSEAGFNGQGDATPVATAVATAGAAVSREFTNVLADAEDLLKATTAITGEDLARIRAQLAKGVAAAKQSIEDMGGAVADSARKTAKATDTYVHEQPWKVIGASAAVAFLLGMLIARRT
jgi:ElaB/YqjD/DUF883 family membrane-anchored ribosome-binding protein